MAQSKEMLRVLKARERVSDRDKWFADVIYNIPIVESKACKTMDTNGICIRFNPDFVAKIADKDYQVEAVFCHEGWHPILDHIARRGTRNPEGWNIACDAIVNPIVRKRGWTLPEGAVFIPEIEQGWMSAERAYEYLRTKVSDKPRPENEENEENEEQEDTDNEDEETGSGGVHIPGNEGGEEGKGDPLSEEDFSDLPEEGSERMIEPSQKELDKFRQKIERAIQSATDKATKEGRMDPIISKALEMDDKVAPPLNWDEVLQEMIATNRNYEARTWSRPNRRYLGQGEIRPGYLRDQINRLCVLYDTSGSVYDEANRQMKKVTAKLLEEKQVSSIIMISVDTEVQAYGEVTTPEEVIDFNLNIRRGGTNFDSAMKRVAEIEDLVGVVFLTDMETSSFGPDPMVPVVWVNWGREQYTGSPYWPPYGRVVKYEKEDA